MGTKCTLVPTSSHESNFHQKTFQIGCECEVATACVNWKLQSPTFFDDTGRMTCDRFGTKLSSQGSTYASQVHFHNASVFIGRLQTPVQRATCLGCANRLQEQFWRQQVDHSIKLTLIYKAEIAPQRNKDDSLIRDVMIISLRPHRLVESIHACALTGSGQHVCR